MRVFVVEDEPQMREVIAWALEEEGFLVTLCGDGREAMEIVRQTKPALVLLDIGLPGADGYAVADFVRKKWDSVPILIMTADGRAAMKARRIGAYDFVNKPFDLADLMDAVRRGLPPQ